MTLGDRGAATSGPGMYSGGDHTTPRILPLDRLRGVAVMGILLMNVNAFAMPFAAYDNPANHGPARLPDLMLWAAELVLVDGKLRAIFSALFGASLLLVTDRAAASGRAAGRVGLARLATLLLFGLAHACLVWAGDILVLYALVGLVALSLRRLPTDRMLVLAGLLLALQGAILALHYQGLWALADAATALDAPHAAKEAWRAALDVLGPPSPAALAADLRLHHGPWPALVANLAGNEAPMMSAELLLSGPETLGLMLLGMAGLRSGFLAGTWRPRTYARIARLCYIVGLPPLLAIAWWLLAHGTPPLATAMLTDLVAMPFRWLVAVGHCALLVPVFTRAAGPWGARIAAVGRTAFSNYLGTSLFMTALFEGWGFGLYGRIERWALLPIVLAMWALMLAWSAPWLRRFAYGPFEWAWRSLARGKPQPFRRNAIASGSHPQ